MPMIASSMMMVLLLHLPHAPLSGARPPPAGAAPLSPRTDPDPSRPRAAQLSPESVARRARPILAQHAAERCPSCGERVSQKKMRRHQAFCCPDLLDPAGWHAADRATVLEYVRRTYARHSLEARLMRLRFTPAAGGEAPSQRALGARLALSPRKVRDTIASVLHSIPPPAEPHAPLEVLYEDAHLLAVNKPAGVPVTPPHRLRTGSLLNRVIAHVGPAAPLPAPVHRLDLNTSGVLLLAKTGAAAARVMAQFEERRVQKTYAAVCAGVPPAAHTVVRAAICADGEATGCRRRACAAGEAGGLAASTGLWVVGARRGEGGGGGGSVAQLKQRCRERGLKVGGRKADLIERLGGALGLAEASLLLAAPEQGRTHQVRIHCAEAGAPLLGDDLYGRLQPDVIQRHALHALTLLITHPFDGKELELLAPLPEDMRRAIESLHLKPTELSSTNHCGSGPGWEHLHRLVGASIAGG
ncbi:hypothetical protein AB1Y20_023220 [Prymnesium parvum]|uniref:SAP domain-containing protein n=1 Tax=Prymnesium parvum TaxID=97485 RepID=A0AB34JDG8_PRYPA